MLAPVYVRYVTSLMLARVYVRYVTSLKLACVYVRYVSSSSRLPGIEYLRTIRSHFCAGA